MIHLAIMFTLMISSMIVVGKYYLHILLIKTLHSVDMEYKAFRWITNQTALFIQYDPCKVRFYKASRTKHTDGPLPGLWANCFHDGALWSRSMSQSSFTRPQWVNYILRQYDPVVEGLNTLGLSQCWPSLRSNMYSQVLIISPGLIQENQRSLIHQVVIMERFYCNINSYLVIRSSM